MRICIPPGYWGGIHYIITIPTYICTDCTKLVYLFILFLRLYTFLLSGIVGGGGLGMIGIYRPEVDIKKKTANIQIHTQKHKC